MKKKRKTNSSRCEVNCYRHYDLVQSRPVEIDSFAEELMNILAAIKREERKLEKQLSTLQKQLGGVRTAAKALGHSAGNGLKSAKKRVLSAAGRAAISKAAKR